MTKGDSGFMTWETFTRKLYWKTLRQVSRILYHLPVKKNRIIFDNFGGKGFGDNPKYIAQALHELRPDLELIWLQDNRSDGKYPPYIVPVPINSIRGLYARATAKVWVDNVRHLHPVRKKTNQIYLQTWHAPFSPKRVERDAEEQLNDTYIAEAKYDGSIIDGILANSKLQENQYRRAFWLNNNAEILRFGLPRNDYLANSKRNTEIIEKAKTQIGIDDQYYYVLYAPTFRDDYSTKGYEIDYEKVRHAFEHVTRKKCKIIVRLHPNAAFQKERIRYTEDIIDGTDYPDMQQLALACHAVISDYSTSLFDFALLGKPAFIFTLDLAEYENKRGLLEEFYEFPFPQARTNLELVTCIMSFDEQKYAAGLKEYFARYPIYDQGDAAMKSAEWILKMIVNTTK